MEDPSRPNGSQNATTSDDRTAGGSQRTSHHECAVCHTVNRLKGIRQCTRCSLWSHLTCVKLTRSQSANLPVWHCRPCILQPDGAFAADSSDRAQLGDPPPDWAEALAKCKRSMPLIQRLPPAVRGPVAERLASVIEEIIQCPSSGSWWNLFSFAYRYLRAPDKDSPDRITNASAIRQALNCSDPTADLSPTFEQSATHHHYSDLMRRIRSKCADGDLRAALRLLTSDDTVLKSNAETIAALRSKHPLAPNGTELPNPLPISPANCLNVDSRHR